MAVRCGVLHAIHMVRCFTPKGGTDETALVCVDVRLCSVGSWRVHPSRLWGQVASDGVVHCRMEEDEGGRDDTIRPDLAQILESMCQGLRCCQSGPGWRRTE